MNFQNYFIIFIGILILMTAIQNQSTAQAIVPDFKINTETGTLFDKGDKAIAVNGNGNYYVCWIDERNLSNGNVYVQRFSPDGTQIGDNILVNDDANNREQIHPAIAADKNGNFVVAWSDNRKNNNYFRLWAQLFDSSGTKLGDNFHPDSNPFSLFNQFSPSVAFTDSGKMIFTWQDGQFGDPYYDIVGRIVNANGSTYGGNTFKINDDSQGNLQTSAVVSSNNRGEFVVTWKDYRGDWQSGDIMAQRFDVTGNLVGTNFYVSDEFTLGISQTATTVVLNDSGQFIFSWNDDRYAKMDVFARRYDRNGIALGAAFQVGDSPDTLNQGGSAVVLHEDGRFLISWTDLRTGVDIYAQAYDSTGNTSGSNFIINEDTTNSQVVPVAGLDDNGHVIIVWSDFLNNSDMPDLRIRKFSINGTPQGQSFIITDPTWGATQRMPDAAVSDNGQRIAVWVDYRNGNGDIFAQCFDENTNPVGTNIQISSDNDLNIKSWPSISFAGNDTALIVWTSGLPGQSVSIIGQFITANGNIIQDNFLIGDGDSPEVVEKNGIFYITWKKNIIPADYGNIYMQRFQVNGTPIDTTAFQVNDDLGNDFQGNPSIAVNDNEGFVVAWEDYRNISQNRRDIYAQVFDNLTNPVGNNFMVNDNQANVHQDSPCAAAADSGRFVIAFTDRRNTPTDIYAQYLESDGSFIGVNYRVNPDTAATFGKRNPAIAADDSGRVIITWQNWRNIQADVYAQRFSNGNVYLDSSFIVHENDDQYSQTFPAVKLWQNEIFTVWVDDSNERTGEDIWGNVLDWDNPVVNGIDQTNLLISDFNLYQNYPNPFNPSTTIRYQLSTNGMVNLNIYNALGQRVTSLVSERQQTGSYNVVWDASAVASGVYFYQLKTGDLVLTRKMILIR